MAYTGEYAVFSVYKRGVYRNQREAGLAFGKVEFS
jgi:hypothetical protein